MNNYFGIKPRLKPMGPYGLVLFSFLAFQVGACNPKNAGFLAGKNVLTTSKDDKVKNDTDSEKVDIPANISGSYLICALRKSASDTDLSSEYGCRLNESGTEQKLDLGSNQNRVKWSSDIQGNIRIEQMPAGSLYHATYTLTGANRASIQDLAGRMEVLVQWFNPGSTQALPFKNQPLLDVLRPASSVGDSSAPILQGQGLDPTDPGTL